MDRIKEKLLKKYSTTGPRYTSYPPATFFDTNFTNDEYEEKLIQSNNEYPQSISVYIHIPSVPKYVISVAVQLKQVLQSHSLKDI